MDNQITETEKKQAQAKMSNKPKKKEYTDHSVFTYWNKKKIPNDIPKLLALLQRETDKQVKQVIRDTTQKVDLSQNALIKKYLEDILPDSWETYHNPDNLYFKRMHLDTLIDYVVSAAWCFAFDNHPTLNGGNKDHAHKLHKQCDRLTTQLEGAFK